MKDSDNHRKLVKHYEDPSHVRELTFSCYERRPLLVNDAWRVMLGQAIDRAMDNHHWRLTAFVFMPEHVHLLVFPEVLASPISALLSAIKRPYSFRIKQLLADERNALLEQLTIRQRPGKTTFRYWQEGPGYDRNLESQDTVLYAIDYLHKNPTRRQLCSRTIDWRWSSARWYEDSSIVDKSLPKLSSLPADFFS